jgi:large subunit ribosomal protein L23
MTDIKKDPRDVIIKPIISEKSYALIDEGKYTFEVDTRSNKTEIKRQSSRSSTSRLTRSTL